MLTENVHRLNERLPPRLTSAIRAQIMICVNVGPHSISLDSVLWPRE